MRLWRFGVFLGHDGDIPVNCRSRRPNSGSVTDVVLSIYNYATDNKWGSSQNQIVGEFLRFSGNSDQDNEQRHDKIRYSSKCCPEFKARSK